MDVDHLMTCSPELDTQFGPAHYEYMTRLISHNINFHLENGFNCFVINYVFGHQQMLDLMYLLKKSPAAASGGIFSFCLWSRHTLILQKNITKRALPNLDWELKRSFELHEKMTKLMHQKELGELVLVHDDAGIQYKPEVICQDILSKIEGILTSKPKLESIDVGHQFIDWMLAGSKKATTRKFKEERSKWKTGDMLLAVNSSTKKPFAIMRLNSVETPKFGELSSDLANTENFGSVDEFKQVLRDIYPDINTTGDSTLMHVFHFTVLHYL